jgi:hypothetical protein
MGRLSPAELRGRLAFDYRTIRLMTGGALGAVRAYASAGDFRAGREVAEGEARQGAAIYYRVEYAFKHLVGKGRVARHAVAAFDLLAGGNYPLVTALPQCHRARLPRLGLGAGRRACPPPAARRPCGSPHEFRRAGRRAQRLQPRVRGVLARDAGLPSVPTGPHVSGAAGCPDAFGTALGLWLPCDPRGDRVRVSAEESGKRRLQEGGLTP